MPLSPSDDSQWNQPDLTQLEADLDDAIQSFERIQSDLGYQHAQESLQTLLKKLDLSRREQAGLETEVASLQAMLDKLENQVVHIAVFGLVSRGKSSLLNALVGQSIFATGPTHGVTQTTQQTGWNIYSQTDNLVRVVLAGSGQSQVELIDTPGIDEVGGEDRERLAREVAQQADLILFVIAGDLTKVEYEALSSLRKASKPLLLVFNKVDQYPDADRQLIYEKIRDDRVRELLSPDEIVMAAAAPLVATAVQRSDGSLGAEMVPGPPQVEDLKLKILEILDREGKAIVALNTLLYADDIHGQVVQRKMDIRDRSANQVIWQSVITKGVAIALNPITLVDILSSAVIDIAMILTLSKLYGISMTQQGAVGLLRNIAVAMGGISASELLATFGLSSLKGILGLAAPATGGASLVPYLSVALTQAAVAGVSSYSIGQVTKTYLSNGASWGPQGPKTVVTEILNSLDHTYILSRIKTELRQKLDPISRP
ncbi:MAG: GTP-binding protein [Thermosynechococcaceae cyanobacterium]